MAKRDVCDRDLKVDVSGEQFAVLEIKLTRGEEVIVDTKMSICPECQPVIEKLVLERVMLTDTPDDVKVGTLFVVPQAPTVQAARTQELEP